MIARNLDSYQSPSYGRVRKFSAVVGLLLFGVNQLSAQEPCPQPAGYEGNPLSKPSITAGEVAATVPIGHATLAP